MAQLHSHCKNKCSLLLWVSCLKLGFIFFFMSLQSYSIPQNIKPISGSVTYFFPNVVTKKIASDHKFVVSVYDEGMGRGTWCCFYCERKSTPMNWLSLCANIWRIVHILPVEWVMLELIRIHPVLQSSVLLKLDISSQSHRSHPPLCHLGLFLIPQILANLKRPLC